MPKSKRSTDKGSGNEENDDEVTDKTQRRNKYIDNHARLLMEWMQQK